MITFKMKNNTLKKCLILSKLGERIFVYKIRQENTVCAQHRTSKKLKL